MLADCRQLTRCVCLEVNHKCHRAPGILAGGAGSGSLHASRHSLLAIVATFAVDDASSSAPDAPAGISFSFTSCRAYRRTPLAGIARAQASSFSPPPSRDIGAGAATRGCAQSAVADVTAGTARLPDAEAGDGGRNARRRISRIDVAAANTPRPGFGSKNNAVLPLSFMSSQNLRRGDYRA